MEKHWWYELNDQPKGPVSQQDLMRLLLQNDLTDENFVWQHGMRKWMKMGEIKNNLLQQQQVQANAQTNKKNWLTVILVVILLVALGFILFHYAGNKDFVVGLKRY